MGIGPSLRALGAGMYASDSVIVYCIQAHLSIYLTYNTIAMTKYNFVSKESSNVLDNIEFVVNNCNDIQLKCRPSEATVVSLFETLFVGYPIAILGEMSIGGFSSETTGWFLIGYKKIYFSIHNNILYLRARY